MSTYIWLFDLDSREVRDVITGSESEDPGPGLSWPLSDSGPDTPEPGHKMARTIATLSAIVIRELSNVRVTVSGLRSSCILTSCLIFFRALKLRHNIINNKKDDIFLIFVSFISCSDGIQLQLGFLLSHVIKTTPFAAYFFILHCPIPANKMS